MSDKLQQYLNAVQARCDAAPPGPLSRSRVLTEGDGASVFDAEVYPPDPSKPHGFQYGGPVAVTPEAIALDQAVVLGEVERADRRAFREQEFGEFARLCDAAVQADRPFEFGDHSGGQSDEELQEYWS